MNAMNDNVKKAVHYMERYAKDGIQHRIDGRLVSSASSFENTTPIDGSTICTVAKGGAEEIDQAARSSAKAFASWKQTTGAERRAILHRIADVMEERAEEVAVLESYDSGQVIRFMQKAALRSAQNFRFFADRAVEAQDGLSLPAKEHMNYTIRQPLGPVGVITPWNTPFMLASWKIAPALAAGCTVVHKPAEWSPVSGALMSEIAHEAGLPDGVLNTVHGVGEEAGKALTEHPLIQAIAFVGDSKTGTAIQAQGAETLKRVHFELGGKNPVIIFEDADLDRAIDAAVFMIYSLNGERCTSSSRVLIERPVYEHCVEEIAKRARAIKSGHPLDPSSELGPLIHPRHLEKVKGYFSIAKEDGVRVAAGGKTPDPAPVEGGHFVEATLFADARQDMRVAREEIFGPVLTAIPFSGEEEALNIANDVDYGLTGYVWTRDISRALRVSHALEAGMIWVNSENVRHLPSPFGGMKRSGIGRDGGDYSFDFYMETKNICLAMGPHRIPKLGTS